MNATKFNKYLKKIKSFGDLVENLESLSLIEKDLLKDYIKKLYESISESDESHKPEKKAKKQKKNSEVEKKRKHADKVEEIIEESSEVEEIHFEEPIIETDAEKEENFTKPDIDEEVTLEDKQENIPQVSQDLLDLFEISDSNELSHKLSLTPIKNLTKSFSINERIFTVKELFGGEKQIFDEVLKDLDNLDNLEEAKNYLLKNVVDKFGWDEPRMIKKVKGFVENVKRRYL